MFSSGKTRTDSDISTTSSASSASTTSSASNTGAVFSASSASAISSASNTSAASSAGNVSTASSTSASSGKSIAISTPSPISALTTRYIRSITTSIPPLLFSSITSRIDATGKSTSTTDEDKSDNSTRSSSNQSVSQSAPNSARSDASSMYSAVDENENGWTPYNDDCRLLIHNDSFRRGWIVFKFASAKIESNSDTVTLNNRELKFHSIKKNTTPIQNIQKPNNLLSTLTSFIEKSTGINPRLPSYIINERRSEEVFFPLLLNNETSLHLWPWLGYNVNKKTKDEFAFSGFEHYVTAGCLFGPILLGLNQKNHRFTLIKHHIELYPEEIINTVFIEGPSLSAYEEVLFHELKKLICFILQFSDKTKELSLSYHLPATDYMLFGIELFIRGKMTLGALSQFFDLILQQKNKHIEKIKKICPSSIKLKISSPFENLFDSAQPFSLNAFLKNLNIPIDETNSVSTIDPKKINEKELVARCVQLLTTNTFNIEHQTTWKDFDTAIEQGKIKNDTIEDLFKIANAAFLAIAAKGKKDYKVCSLLPVSEKQIQVGYDSSIKELSRSAISYPGIFFGTYLSTVVGYGINDSRGLLFYFEHYPIESAKLINKLFKHAQENMIQYAQGSIPLHDVQSTLTHSPETKQTRRLGSRN